MSSVFRDSRTFAGAAHLVMSWFLLAFLGYWAFHFSVRSIGYAWSLGPYHPSPLSHTMPEEDFANLWAAGHLVRLGRLDWVYSSPLFEAWKQARFGASLRVQDWIYPPSVLLLGVPLSFLPLLPAFFLWDSVTLVIAILVLRWARLPWPILLVGLLGPATWRSLTLGQYGAITGALVIAGLMAAPGRPIRAGILLGLATLKPQQGVIVPVAWLAARAWRPIAAAAATLLALALLTSLLFGPHAWVLFFTNSSAMAKGILDLPPPQDNINTGVSVFWMCRTFGWQIGPSYDAQFAAAILAVGLTWFAWARPCADPLARIAFTACASLMITPYGYTSDMVAYSIGVAVIASRNGWRLRLVDVVLWFWPFYCTLVTKLSGLLLTPVFTAAAAGLAWRLMERGKDDSKQEVLF
jgi:hypothetical protein